MTKEQAVERARKGGQARAKLLGRSRRSAIAQQGGWAKHHGREVAAKLAAKSGQLASGQASIL